MILSCSQCGTNVVHHIEPPGVHVESCWAGVCEIQAEEYLVAPPVEAMASTEEQTTGFMDAAAGVDVGVPSGHSDFDLADAVTSAGLSEYLSRPVRIASFTWSQSDAPGVLNTFSPWNLFFNNTYIKYKLNNYAFLRANLKVKFVLNASPFYYGSMRACYQPLPAFKQSTIVGGSQSGYTNPELIPYSQQPGIWLKPQHSEGAEMTLPFFYPRSFLRAQVAQDFTDMGTMRMIIYNALASANGVAASGVSVQVFAWADDVVLAGPSVGLAMQADEYGAGAISAPASTLASLASKLKSVPTIGKFATATEIGANAVAGIAKLFGYTNVPVISDTHPYRPSPFPQLASPELGYPVEKLTMDSKNELSIDPTIVGLPATDELAIQNFATRQSYLCSSSWSTSDPVDLPLFTSKVIPVLGWGNTTGGYRNYVTPMGLCGQLFKSWRGDIIFTFRFIASPFHKGRVRISYDPYNSTVQTTADTGPTVFNQVLDLGAETEVDVRIPYQQALAWCYNYVSPSEVAWSTSGTPIVGYTDTYDNGIISVKILTALSAPVASSTINMQVFVRAAENIEFANPATLDPSYTAFALQSAEYSEKREGEVTVMGQKGGDIEAQRARVNFGENIRSLRSLLRRSNFIDAICPSVNATGNGYFTITQTRFPLYMGYDPAGWNTAKGTLVPASNFPVNFVSLTPWHYIANCFIGQRGSVHWHYNPFSGSSFTTARATRNNQAYLGTSASFNVIPVSTSTSVNALMAIGAATPSMGGTALVNTNTTGGLSVSVPNYSAFKFQSTDPRNSSAPTFVGGRYDGSVYEGLDFQFNHGSGLVSPVSWRVERYFGVGTDYSLYFFLNCPVLYSLNERLMTPV